MKWKPHDPALQSLITAFLDEVSPVYVVGGAVRDYLLDPAKPVADLDLALAQPAIVTARRVADRLGWAFYTMDEGRDIARLVFLLRGGEPLVCDVARLQGDSIEIDLLARDFTVNAMAFSIHAGGETTLIDICGGEADLRNSLLRRVTAMSLAEDAVRLVRGVRLAAQFGFSLEEETRRQLKRLSNTIRLASAERVRDELWKISTSSRPAWAIEELRTLSLLAHVLPEVAATIDIEQSAPHHRDVYGHTLDVIEIAADLRTWIARDNHEVKGSLFQATVEMLAPWRHRLRNHFLRPMAATRQRLDWLIWHALMHDVGKPTTRTRETGPDGAVRYRFLTHDEVGAEMTENRLDALRFGRQEVGLCKAVVRNHMRPHSLDDSFGERAVSRRASYRFFRDVGGKRFSPPAGIDTLILALADMIAVFRTQPGTKPEYLAHIDQLLTFAFDDARGGAAVRPLLDGHRLMSELDIEPGPSLGELIEYLLEAQAADEITTEEGALALAGAWLQEKNDRG